MASRINLQHTSARHHALHHFATKPKWLDSAFMSGVQDWVVPVLGLDSIDSCIIGDTRLPKRASIILALGHLWEGTNSELSSCFAGVRVHRADRDSLGIAIRAEEWLLIEWPEGKGEPPNTSSLPRNTGANSVCHQGVQRHAPELTH